MHRESTGKNIKQRTETSNKNCEPFRSTIFLTILIINFSLLYKCNIFSEYLIGSAFYQGTLCRLGLKTNMYTCTCVLNQFNLVHNSNINVPNSQLLMYDDSIYASKYLPYTPSTFVTGNKLLISINESSYISPSQIYFKIETLRNCELDKQADKS